MHVEIIACLDGFVDRFITSNLLYYFTSLLLFACYRTVTHTPCGEKKKSPWCLSDCKTRNVSKASHISKKV